MKQRYLYVVGQPDTHANAAAYVHSLGYQLGILLDEKLTLAHPERFDRVEHVRYDELDTELARLDRLDLSVAGLLCTYENYIVAKAKLGEHFGVPAPSVESARFATDKSLMRQAFLAADPTITPDFTKIDTLDEALAFAAQHDYPLIIKPTNLVKSLLVLRCDSEQELINNFTYAQQTIRELYRQYHIYEREPQLIIEEFIVGKQCSIAAFVDAEGTPHFCEGVVELTNAQDIGVDDNYLYRRILPGAYGNTLTRELYRVAESGIRALKMRSVPAHVELMHGEHGVKIIEIGARIGGYRPRMYRYGYDLDLSKAEIQLALGGTVPDLSGTPRARTAVYELFPTISGKFIGLSEEIDPAQFAYFRITKAPGERMGPAKNGYKAAVIIIVAEADEAIFRQKCALIEQLRVEVST